MWEFVLRDAAALVRDAEDDVLRRLADEHFDGRRAGGLYGAVVFDDGLEGVAQEFADYVLEVRRDVREGGVEVTLDLHFGQVNLWPVELAG